MQNNNTSKPLICRIKTKFQGSNHLKSEASTSHIQHKRLLSLGENSQILFTNNATTKELSMSPQSKFNSYDVHLLDLERINLNKLEGNANHVQKQNQPLRIENVELKEHIQAYHHYMEQQRQSLSQLIQDISSDSENRLLIKKIGNFETLILLLKDDLSGTLDLIRQQKTNIFKQDTLIEQLSYEKQNAHQKIRQEMELVNVKIKDELQLSQSESQARQEQIDSLEHKLIDENERIILAQMQYQEEYQELQKSIQNYQLIEESQKLNYQELQSQTENQMTLLRADFLEQQTHQQDQYTFSMGELRFAYEVRMERLQQDSENKIRVVVLERDRLQRELDQKIKELRLLSKEKDILHGQLQDITNQLSVTTSSLNNTKGQVQQLQLDISQARRVKQDQEIQTGQLMRTLKDTQNDQIKTKNELSNLQIQFQEKQIRNDVLKEEQIYFQEQISQLKENYEAQINFQKTQMYNQQLLKNSQKGSIQFLSKSLIKTEENYVQVLEQLVEQEDELNLTDESSQLLHNSIKSKSQEQILNDILQIEQQQLVDELNQSHNTLKLTLSDEVGQIDEHSKASENNKKSEDKLLNIKQNEKENKRQKDSTQQKHQNKIVHLKAELKKAKTLLYSQNDKLKKVSQKVKNSYILNKDQNLIDLKGSHEKKLNFMYSSSKNLKVSQDFIQNDPPNETEALQDAKEEENQLELQYHYQNELQEQYNREVYQINKDCDDKIRHASLVQTIYEKQFEEYDKKYSDLQELSQEVVNQSSTKEQENTELLKVVSELEQQNSIQGVQYSKDSENQLSITLQMKQSYEFQIKQIRIVVERAEDELIRQEQDFRNKVQEMSKIIEAIFVDNKSMQDVIFQNEDKSKKYVELKQQLQKQSDQTLKIQDQLVKASDVIKYFVKELENYKNVYNIFAPLKERNPQPQINTLQSVFENRQNQSKVQRQKVKSKQELYNLSNLGQRQRSFFQISPNTSNLDIINNSFLPHIIQDLNVQTDRPKKFKYDVSDSLKQYTNTQQASTSINNSPKEFVSENKDISLFFEPELYKQSQLLIQNLYDKPKQKGKNQQRLRNGVSVNYKANRSVL